MKTDVLLFMAGEFVCGIYVATGMDFSIKWF